MERSNHLVDFNGPQQLEDAIECSRKVTALLKEDCTATPTSEYCTVHPQMKRDVFCMLCRVEVCSKCSYTEHKNCKLDKMCILSSEETRRLGEAADSTVELLEEIKRAVSGVKEMKQRVRNRKDDNINMAREVFARSTLRKALDEREEETIADIKEGADRTEKALEV